MNSFAAHRQPEQILRGPNSEPLLTLIRASDRRDFLTSDLPLCPVEELLLLFLMICSQIFWCIGCFSFYLVLFQKKRTSRLSCPRSAVSSPASLPSSHLHLEWPPCLRRTCTHSSNLWGSCVWRFTCRCLSVFPDSRSDIWKSGLGFGNNFQ